MVGGTTKEVFSYVPKPLKDRLRRIKDADPGWSESRVIRKSLERFLPELERQLGIEFPVQRQHRANSQRISPKETLDQIRLLLGKSDSEPQLF